MELVHRLTLCQRPGLHCLVVGQPPAPLVLAYHVLFRMQAHATGR
jgi:hypothetical protein